MFNSKLLSILETFEKKEVRQCHALISSPFFNKNESLIKLYEYCVQSYPDFESDRFEKETVYRNLFPDQPFDDANMRYLMSDLTKLLEQFLIQQTLKENQKNQMELLLEAKLKRKLYSHFKTTFKKQQTKINKSAIRDANYFKHQFKINEKLATIETLAKEQNGDIESLKKAENYLDTFYIATKLKYACLVQNFRLVGTTDYDPIFTEMVLDYVENNESIKSNPLVYNYYLAYMMRVSDDDIDGKYFTLLTKQMEEKINIFKIDEAQNLYALLRNFCIRKRNQGQSEYNLKLLNIYKMQLEDESLFFPNKYLSQWNYININRLSIFTDQFDFSEKFIKKYRSRLNPVEAESAYAFACAELEFYKGNYDQAQLYLHEVNTSKPYDYFVAKALLIKIYYERNDAKELETMDHTIKALHNFTMRKDKKIAKFHKTSYLRFGHYMKKLLKIKLGRKVDKNKLKEEFKNEKNCAETTWLTKIINALDD